MTRHTADGAARTPSRYWHQHPDTVERLAGEYALGAMAAPARRRLEALMRQRPDVHQAVWAWHERLGGALAAQTPLPVDAKQWQRLQERVFPVATSERPAKASWWSRWVAPIPVATLVAGVMLGSVIVPLMESSRTDAERSTQLPASYVGVLATPDGKPGLIVSSLRKGTTVDLKQLAPVAVPDGQTLFLWSIDKDGKVLAIAPIPNGPFASATLSAPAETTFLPAVELAVSIEPQGSTPTQPSGAFVYRGLCGKLWPPAKP
jgi:anti-sigma-K factor RskA